MNDDLWINRQEAKIADDNDILNDSRGITNPNLHRRIDNNGETIVPELAPRYYNLSIYGYNSYRCATLTFHDEESVTSEIP